MMYAICNKTKAVKSGVLLMGHRTKDDQILLNEREVMINQNLSGTIKERVASLDGTLYSETQVINILKQDNWK